MEIEEQHPIPQQVSSYQFKLVGDMTLQQFFYVAGGALVSLLIYSSTLPSYVKFPLILISFLLGIALAFFPLEDRPLAKWIILFLKAIYSPTLYVWKQMPAKFSYFQKEPDEQLQNQPNTQKIQGTEEVKHEGSAKLEIQEQKFLENVSKVLNNSNQQLLQTNDLGSNKNSVNTPQGEQIKDSQVKVPTTESVNVEHQEKQDVKVEEKKQQISNNENMKLTPSSGQKNLNAQSAKFSPEAAPPMPPTKANIVVGQVVDPEGKIVDSAILEIRDSEGRPVRALKSNKLGHFMIVTPLANGNYQITTEKEGFIFDTINIEATGKIIPPIAIWAKTKVNKESVKQTNP